MKLPSPFKYTKSPSFPSSSWPWPTCADPKAFSFRAENTTINSVFVPEEHSEFIASSSDSNSASESSRRHVISTADELDTECFNSADAIESVIRGVKKSERLFFEPSSSTLREPEKNKINNDTTNEDENDSNRASKYMVIEMETMDPFMEFKESMKEMVEAHGLDSLDGLEEMLSCYLRVNGKCNHGYIIGAFVDLLVNHDEFDFTFSSTCFSSDYQSTTCISQSPVSASSLSSFSASNCKCTTAASGASSSEDEEARA